MDAAFVESLIRLFEHSSLIELDYAESGGDRLRLSRHAAQVSSAGPPAPTARTDHPPLETARPSVPPAAPPIVASFHGTFHRCPAPGKAPFVEVGDAVAEGQTLGILEAMKVLNRIEADQAGRILAILARDGETVEAGATLFTLAPELA